jgi:hypothetical protein
VGVPNESAGVRVESPHPPRSIERGDLPRKRGGEKFKQKRAGSSIRPSILAIREKPYAAFIRPSLVNASCTIGRAATRAW